MVLRKADSELRKRQKLKTMSLFEYKQTLQDGKEKLPNNNLKIQNEKNVWRKTMRIKKLALMLMIFIGGIISVNINSRTFAAHVGTCSSTSTRQTYSSNGSSTHTVKVYCNSCGGYLYQTSASHSGGSATCTSGKTCSDCGATYGSSLGHDYYCYQTDAATCTSVGKQYYRCSRDWSHNYTTEIAKDSNNHSGTATTTSYTDKTTTQHTTVVTYNCCGAQKSSTISNHSWDTSHKCTVCGYQGSHSYGAYTYVDETNHKRTCACGNEETNAHSGGTATCTEAPVCSSCNKSYGSINESNHNYTLACPTCGTENIVCTRDNTHIESHTCDSI